MRFVKLFVALAAVVILVSCSAQPGNAVVAEFGKEKIYLNEFEKAYVKNSGGREKAKTDSIGAYKKFLDLFVNYKMKLRDGEVRGYASDSDMKKEYDDYKASIGTTLMLEKEIYEPSMKQLFERRKVEYRASHIFLQEDSTRNKEQTEALTNELIARLNKGESFAKLAADYSKDQNTAKRGGDVGYFTAGMVNLPQIEDAIYSLQPGQVFQKPVFSGYGFHILKVTDIRPRRVSLRADHILTLTQDSTGNVDTVRAFNKIKEIEKRIKAGEDFGELAFKLSEDKGSQPKRGDIGFFEHGRVVQEFDDAAFKLKVGEISPIVKTQFGYHIIRLTDETLPKSYEEEKADLRELAQRMRYKSEYDKLVERYKKEFNFSLNKDIVGKIVGNADTTKITQGYPDTKIAKNVGPQALFSIAQKSFSVDSLFSFMLRNASYMGRGIDQKTLEGAIDQYAGEIAVREKAMSFDKVDADFASLMAEYKNGMYLFKILEEEVWQKIVVDSARTKSYWDANKSKFNWGNRVEFKEIYVDHDSLKSKIEIGLNNGVAFDTLYNRYNKRSGYENKPGYYGLVDITANELARQANSLDKPGAISKAFVFDTGWSFVKLIRKDPARQKSFDEAKPEAASMLQEIESKRLEEEYLTKLKRLYNPTLYYEELNNAFKN